LDVTFATARYRIGCKGFVACSRKNPDKFEFQVFIGAPFVDEKRGCRERKRIVAELSAPLPIASVRVVRDPFHLDRLGGLRSADPLVSSARISIERDQVVPCAKRMPRYMLPQQPCGANDGDSHEVLENMG
jgi:hypothetical protein